MARIRTIKPEFFKHEGIFDAEQETGLPLRLAFAGLWTQCDREGRFAWRPRQLKVDILPYDELDFLRVLDALATRGFIVKYASDGREFGFIPSWHRHQVINNRETASVLPEPSEFIAVSDACATRASRDGHAGKAERKGKERNIYSRKMDLRASEPPHGDTVEQEFTNTFWPAYPRKVDRKDALSAFLKARKKVSLEAIMKALEAYSRETSKADKRFIRHAARWLNAESWENGDNQHPPHVPVDDEKWLKRLRQGRNLRKWSVQDWGPRPGNDGCLVPASLLEPGDGDGWTEFEVAA